MDSFMVPDSDICLGIPVPQFVQDLLPDIPSPPESSVDDEIRSAIEVFGRGDERTTSDQIVKACELAQGYDDLVILLQQPVASHNYSKPFAEFVYASPTLKAVDEALRFVTKGRRSINNTSVLDAFMFKTWQREEEGDFKRHELVKRLLHIKKPGAVLACCNTIRLEHWLAGNFPGSEPASSPHVQERQLWGRTVVCVRCFHPSYCLRRRPCEPRLRMALILAFGLALARTRKKRDALSEVASFVQPPKGNTPDERPTATRLSNLLRELHGMQRRPVTWADDESSEESQQKRAKETKEEIYDLLWILDQAIKTNSYFLVAETCLLWQKLHQTSVLQSAILQPIFLHNLAGLCRKQTPFTYKGSDTVRKLEALSLSILRTSSYPLALQFASEAQYIEWRADKEIQSMKLKALERALDEQLAMGPTGSSSVGPSEAHPSELAGECVDKLKSALRVISAGRDLLCSEPDVPKDPDRSHSAISDDIGLKTVVQKVVLEGMVSLKGLVTSISTLIETLEDQSEMLRTPTMRGSRTGQRTPTAIRDSAALTSADNAVMRVMSLRRQLAQIAIGNIIEVEATAPKSEESRISFKKKTRG